MKRFWLTLATLLVSLMCVYGTPRRAQTVAKIKAHIEYLTSSELAGRKAGSEGGYAAGDYIRSEFSSLGLKTFERADYYHNFTTSLEDGVFRNVVGRIDGIDRNSYIVIGAHYDHLGTKRGETYPGADDNASGTAALIEVARLFTQMNYKPTHTLLFAAFDAEEIGLYGSKDLAKRLPEGSVKVMINMDMVGWLGEGALQIEGVGTLNGAEEIVGRVATKNELPVKTKPYERKLLLATDTEPFAKRGCPTLALTTGTDSPYHKPEDTAEKIDYEGIAKIVDFVGELTVAIDTSKEATASGKVAKKHHSGNNNFEWGLSYAFGNNYHHYPDSAIRGREAGAWNVGLKVQYTHKHFGLRVGATYENRKALTPADPADPYGKAQTLSTQGVTIPVELMLKTSGRSSAYLLAGGYWSHTFGAKVNKLSCQPQTLGLNTNEWGWSWGLGVQLGGLFFEATNRYALSSLYTTTPPRILNRTTLCTMGWFF